ncbi:peroxisomal membrane anchor protein conserved region-domain-containing protein [Fusarium flagelliforme]|uniref:peroxisomal membrane anchor protein conserved region-domain-containing protein n=1 Tax=Fusarium flagelliforme TaxID=2675880 RepID=UPI001E8E649A|nr:peroxisomal membrane anchor protein conserved region-domain-containing protein [Fusarium flagelliforme]KAH7179405.1 peroxisomal membrane anchor protein conserved region-domain-containing protein [Fusarium flagelliforme]
MSIREDLVTSAIQFLQDPSVASSSVESRISFLRSKNLTQEEIDAALSRTGGSAPSAAPVAPYPSAPAGPPPNQQYYPPYPQHAWQPPPPPPRRDWRDWFIMATVVGGVSYGLYELGKRYVYPMVAPPTPEKLEQDKKSIEDQFDRAFTLVEQLAKDTESLKNAEKERTEKLDVAIADLETVMTDLKAANRRREDDATRIRDEVQSLKDAIPKALENQKSLTDGRLREINTELTSLKTLVSQRMTTPSTTTASSTMNYMRNAGGSATTPAAAASTPAASTPAAKTNGEKATVESATTTPAAEIPKPTFPSAPQLNRSSSPLANMSGKKAIPAWQMAMANQNDTSSTQVKADETKAGASSSS